MRTTAVKQWGLVAVLTGIALYVSAATPVKECLDPPMPRLVPPPEAFEACRSAANGADCEVVLPDFTVAGLCVAGEEAPGLLFCKPFGPPPPPPEALTACEGLAVEETCGIQLDCGVVRGTCASTPAGTLFCRPLFAPQP